MIRKGKPPMALMKNVVIFLLLAVGTFAGSPCPSNNELAPCKCLNVNLTKRKLYTIVICDDLNQTSSLNDVFPQIAKINIDRFIMYDSFWSSNVSGNENLRKLPHDWMNFLAVKEIEIHDTILATCFACDVSRCSNDITTSLKIKNSTASEIFCGQCANNNDVPWLSCLRKLEHLEISYGNIKYITTHVFFTPLSELKILNFSHNKIQKLDTSALRNLPNLTTLDLSHNLIEKFDRIFNTKTNIQFIDLSHNRLKTISGDLLPSLPKAVSINYSYNQVDDFRATSWRRPPNSLRTIDLTDNPIKCDCEIRWVNVTFPVHVAIKGTCAEVEEYKGSRIRTASRAMAERCDTQGRMLNRTRAH